MRRRSASSARSTMRWIFRCSKNRGQRNGAHPLWQWLKHERRGVLGSEAIKWNFTKFLIGRDGRVLERYAPTTKPEALAADIERALGA